MAAAVDEAPAESAEQKLFPDIAANSAGASSTPGRRPADPASLARQILSVPSVGFAEPRALLMSTGLGLYLYHHGFKQRLRRYKEQGPHDAQQPAV